MKKFLEVVLVFLIAFAGGLAGSYGYDRFLSDGRSGSEETSQSIGTTQQVDYVVKESSDLKTAIKKAYGTVVMIQTVVTSNSIFY